DLTTKSDDALIALLGDANVYARETAQRLLSERGTPQIRKGLEEVVRSEQESMTRRLHALWALSGCGDLENDLLGNLIDHDSPSIQKWGIRLAGNKGDVSGPVDRSMLSALFETDLQLRLQATIAARKLSTRYESPEVATISRVNRILSTLEGRGIEASPDPDLLSHVVWQNLKPLVITHPKDVVETLIIWSEDGFPDHTLLVPRILNVLIDTSDPSGEHARLLLTAVMKSKDSDPKLRRECLSLITQLAREGALNDRQSTALTEAINAVNWNTSRDDESRLAAAGMLAIHGDAVAKEMLRQTLIDSNTKTPLRVDSLSSWIASGDKRIASTVKELLLQEETPPELVRELLQCLSRVEDASAPDILLDILPHLENAQRSIALEVLTQRAILSHALLKAIEAKQIDKDAINLNQIARVASFKDEEVQKLVAKIYGQVRSGQRSDRRQMVNNMADFLHGTPGDAERGGLAFKKVCAQCHKIYGEGAEVGPDITRNGRNNWQQLLTNVFDPSAVIGPGYQARILVTIDGRVLTGLAVEESDQRVVLKIQGGKIETIPRDQIEEYKISEASMMPEQLEKQLTPQEIADLFAFLALDKPPSDPEARILPGAPQH
ncbi:MAG: c-type cytochrome, partial [Planctomycetaceae bacterium]|nr:c-type cytochrome [Planctomycetaceae bacterium]